MKNKIEKFAVSTSNSLSTIVGMCLITVFMFTSCGDDDSPKDPRVAFEGTYEISSDSEVYLTTIGAPDTTLVIEINSDIVFEIDTDLDSDELKVELNEFIEDFFEAAFAAFDLSVSFSLDISDDDLVATISDQDFEIELDFEMTVFGDPSIVLKCELAMEGELESNTITFDYDLVYFLSSDPSSKVRFEGEMEAEK